MDRARNVALKTLYDIDKNKAYSNIALDKQLRENRKQLNDKDIGLISEIVYGVTSRRLTLDEIVKKYSKIKLKKISPWILNILRMGIYQIIFLDKIPKSAAVNESVNLAKRYGHKASSNFVNAVLRKVEKNDYEELKNEKNQIRRISRTTSMPEWIIEKLLEQKDIKEVEEICKASNEKAKIRMAYSSIVSGKLAREDKENIVTAEELEEQLKFDLAHENGDKVRVEESIQDGINVLTIYMPSGREYKVNGTIMVDVELNEEE